jgi:hypothetical protein
MATQKEKEAEVVTTEAAGEGSLLDKILTDGKMGRDLRDRGAGSTNL